LTHGLVEGDGSQQASSFHGFAKPENRLRFYTAVDDFFATYM
jgi:hypothetical protein